MLGEMELTRIIGNLGFPIFVAVWLLVRTDRLLQRLIAVLGKIEHALDGKQ